MEVAGRKRAETAGQTLCVGLGSLDGGSGSNDSSNSVSELHLGLVDNGDRKGLIREPESKERVGQRSDVWHEAEGLGNLWRAVERRGYESEKRERAQGGMTIYKEPEHQASGSISLTSDGRAITAGIACPDFRLAYLSKMPPAVRLTF